MPVPKIIKKILKKIQPTVRKSTYKAKKDKVKDLEQELEALKNQLKSNGKKPESLNSFFGSKDSSDSERERERERESNNRAFQLRITQLENEKKALQTKLNKSRREDSGYSEGDNAALTNQIAQLQDQLKQAQTAANNQQQTIADLQQQSQDQQEQNRHSQAQLNHEVEQNEDQRRQYLFDIAIKNRSILFLAGQINNLEQELDELNQENESLRDELEAGLTNKNNLQNRLNILLKQKKILQNKLAGVNEKANNLTTEWEKEQQKNAGLQSQYDLLLYQSQFWQQRPSQQAYQSLKAKKTKQQENYTRQINNLQQKINNSLGQRDNLTNELADLETTAQTYYQTSQQNLADTQQELRDTQQELEDVQQAQTQAAGQLTYYQTQDEGLRNTIINLQTQLTNQQNLNQNLQNQINNHACPPLPVHTDSPCSLVHLPEPHECPVVQNCSHADYDNLKTQLEEKETVIIQRLNEALGSSEKDLQVIINRVKELVHKPPIVREIEIEVENTERIQELEKEVEVWQNTPFGEDLVTIKELELNSLEHLFKQKVDTNTIQKIQQATNYQQVVAARQAFLEKHLDQQNIVQVGSLQTVQQERNQLVKQRNLGLVAAGTILTTGLIATGILGRKVKQLKRENYNYYTDYKQLKDELSQLLVKMQVLMEEKRV